MSREYIYNELKESKLIYDRKPPAFGVIITVMTLIFVIFAVVWAGLSPKTYVVKATGLVVSEEKTNVMNKVQGRIDQINVREGDSVKKGDLLIQINSLHTELQIAQVQANVGFYVDKAALIERLVLFIKGFRLNDGVTRINPFDNTNIAEMSAYDNAQTFIDYVKDQEKIATEKTPPEAYTQAEIDNLKIQFLSQHYPTLDEYKAQIVQHESQLTVYIDSLAEYKIIAEQDGSIHLSAGLTVGTMLQAGSLLGSISSVNNSTFIIEAAVNAIDRAKITIGDSVEIAVSGIMQSEFGLLKGQVISIDSDSTQTEEGSVFYRIKIKPNSTKLENRKGNVVNLSIGMLSESRIKYKETTWLKWMIEQIGVRFR